MSRVKGIVSGKGKGKFSFFVRLDGDPTYYNTKFEPKCDEGDEVGIEFEPKGSNRGNIRKLVVLNKGAGPSPARSYSGNATGGSGGDRQDSIIWQHSQSVAAEVVAAMIAGGGLPSGAAKDTKTAAARKALIEATVDELTYRYFKDASDPRKADAYTAHQEEEAVPYKPEDEWPDPAEAAESNDEWGGDDVEWT